MEDLVNEMDCSTEALYDFTYGNNCVTWDQVNGTTSS